VDSSAGERTLAELLRAVTDGVFKTSDYKDSLCKEEV
jgi:hypothetical protein